MRRMSMRMRMRKRVPCAPDEVGPWRGGVRAAADGESEAEGVAVDLHLEGVGQVGEGGEGGGGVPPALPPPPAPGVRLGGQRPADR